MLAHRGTGAITRRQALTGLGLAALAASIPLARAAMNTGREITGRVRRATIIAIKGTRASITFFLKGGKEETIEGTVGDDGVVQLDRPFIPPDDARVIAQMNLPEPPPLYCAVVKSKMSPESVDRISEYMEDIQRGRASLKPILIDDPTPLTAPILPPEERLGPGVTGVSISATVREQTPEAYRDIPYEGEWALQDKPLVAKKFLIIDDPMQCCGSDGGCDKCCSAEV